ncbi:hypothetical protein PROFUN_04322 [Planoprotostelium fungivorum]|uniref:Uncharacterized protein n=1 Tax=Planoprotostelium fungivorum TaxID=1890364 RepID=A0A2P6NVG3_9EUKA|nr:hypothetical protein PROFUN_04322 [Planoprotostelium fungivorum]
MEERDRYLSRLAVDIQMLAHNKVFHHFYHWTSRLPSLVMERLQKHIHTLMAIGAPWIRCPKIICGRTGRTRVSSSCSPSKNERNSFGRPFLFPMQPPHEPSSKVPLTFLRNEYPNGGADVKVAGRIFDDGYMLGRDLAVLEPLPLICIYGVDVLTETNYLYRIHPTKALVIEENAPTGSVEGQTTIKGIVYEIEDRPQERIEKEPPGRNSNRSGEGSLGCRSLSYCNKWKDKLELECRELKNVEHRAIT